MNEKQRKGRPSFLIHLAVGAAVGLALAVGLVLTATRYDPTGYSGICCYPLFLLGVLGGIVWWAVAWHFSRIDKATKRRHILIAAGVIVVLVVYIGIIRVLRTGIWGQYLTRTHEVSYPAPDQAALDLAESGVSANAEWSPVMQTFDGVKMVLVPAGCFQMGSEDGLSLELPVHEVCFETPFWLDVYEVTNQQYGSSGHWGGPDRPRDSVTWDEAQAHCQDRGARLPTEAEWEYAARGPDGLVFPWGNEFIEGNVVSGRYRQSANVGSKPGDVSWVGTLDMSGNLMEWVYDWYAPNYPSEQQLNPTGPTSGTRHVLRGGNWGTTRRDFYMRSTFRISHDPKSNRSDLWGFRCARSY